MRAVCRAYPSVILATAVIALFVLVGSPAYSQTQDTDALQEQIGQLYSAGKYDEAVPLAKRYAELIKKRHGDAHPDYASAVNNIAFFYKKAGRYAEAEPLYKRALAIWEKALGPDHADVGLSLNNLASLYDSLGRYAEAEPLYKRSLAIREKALGPNHSDVGQSLNNLADLYATLGRHSEAEPLHKRALAIREKALGPNHPDVAASLNNLGNLYIALARHAEAEPLYKRSLAIRVKALGPAHPSVSTALYALASLNEIRGRYTEAEPLYKRSLAVAEKALGPSHPFVAKVLNNLALLYTNQNRHNEAELLYKRALAIKEKVLGSSHTSVALSLNNLALLYSDIGRKSEAEPLYKRALAITEKVFGPGHSSVATSLSNLALLYSDLGRNAEAEQLYKRSLAIDEKALGSGHPHIGTTLNNLALFYERRGRHAEAEPLYSRSLAIWTKAFGPNHPNVASGHSNLGHLDAQRGRWSRAYKHARRAAAIHAARALNGVAQLRDPDGGAKKQAVYFQLEVTATGRLAAKKPNRKAELAEAAFPAAQWAGRTSAAAALGQMAARLGSGKAALAHHVRKQQDLTIRRKTLDKALIKAIGASPGKRDQKAIDDLRAALTAAEKRLAEQNATLEKNFPNYAELSNPRPLEIAQVRKLLGPDEALILYLVNEKESFVWAVTQNRLEWQVIDQQKGDLEKQIATLRQSLDPVAAVDTGGRGLSREQVCRGLARLNKPCDAYDTDLERAHRLYVGLLQPIAKAIKGKRHLMIVPSGPLTGLPFHMLVTSPPPASGELSERFKKAQWLIRQHAVTILPSVSSLRALRVFAQKGQAKRPFIGFGDPDFFKPTEKKNKRGRTRAVQATRGYASYFRGELADVEKLSGVIPPLPDTADELRAVGKVFNAAKSEIVLGRRASETGIKTLSSRGKLDDYRIVHFATHGLIAGEIAGLGEPALALSLPSKATVTDDGLLMASEVAQLKLNADWVVLSACNTAAGDKPGAEAFSGLARAFFYAGARTMLVSHWPVISEAAVKLTTAAFSEMEASPGIGRAEALRRSMLRLIDEGTPSQRHPSYWAPFVVVGEGGTVRNVTAVSQVTTKDKEVAQKPSAPAATETEKVAALAPPTAKRLGISGNVPLHDCDRFGALIYDIHRVGNAPHPGQVNTKRALEACREATRAHPNVARFELQFGNILYEMNRFEEAVKWIRKAADSGHSTAIADLGVLLYQGSGVQKDVSKAITHFQKSADLGNPHGKTQLGTMFVLGSGIGKDYAKARSLFLEAAKEADPYAQYWLGLLSNEGWGVEKNHKEARIWFERAFASGDPDGAAQIGLQYLDGLGVSKNPTEAITWLRKSADRKSAEGNYYLAFHLEDGEVAAYEADIVAKHLLEATRLGEETALSELRSGLKNWRTETRKAVQRQLKTAGFYRGAIDGDLGRGTRRAFEAYLVRR